jgi:hypothetical protein
MPAVGRVDRLDVVVRPVGQLGEPAAVRVDLVQMIRLAAARPVRKQDLVAVVVDLRIADAAARVFEQHAQLARPQIQTAQSAAFAKGKTLAVPLQQRRVGVRRIVAVVAEVAVPVIASGDPLREHNLVEVGRRTGEKPFEHVRRVAGSAAAPRRFGGHRSGRRA